MTKSRKTNPQLELPVLSNIAQRVSSTPRTQSPPAPGGARSTERKASAQASEGDQEIYKSISDNYFRSK